MTASLGTAERRHTPVRASRRHLPDVTHHHPGCHAPSAIGKNDTTTGDFMATTGGTGRDTPWWGDRAMSQVGGSMTTRRCMLVACPAALHTVQAGLGPAHKGMCMTTPCAPTRSSAATHARGAAHLQPIAHTHPTLPAGSPRTPTTHPRPLHPPTPNSHPCWTPTGAVRRGWQPARHPKPRTGPDVHLRP